MLTLDEVKQFLRMDVDMSEDDAFLSSLIAASGIYITNATHPNADTSSELFKIAQRMLVLHWYENRNAVILGSISKNLEFALDSILYQIAAISGDAI